MKLGIIPPIWSRNPPSPTLACLPFKPATVLFSFFTSPNIALLPLSPLHLLNPSHPIPALLSVEWAGWPGNTKNRSGSSYESFLLPAIYIIRTREREKKKNTGRKKDRNGWMLPQPCYRPVRGPPAHASAHADQHLQVCAGIALPCAASAQ